MEAAPPLETPMEADTSVVHEVPSLAGSAGPEPDQDPQHGDLEAETGEPEHENGDDSMENVKTESDANGPTIKIKLPPARRRSGRQRVPTDVYVAEPVPSRAGGSSKVSKKAEKTEKTDKAVKSETADSSKKPAGDEPTKPAAKSKSRKSGGIAKTPEKKKPKMIVKLSYANKQPLPEFVPIDVGTDPEVFWLRLTLREFLLRFDKLCRLPTRHATSINDPLQPWNDYLYKAAIVALFRLIENDTVPIFEQARQFLTEIERTPADSPVLWETLAEFIAQCDPYASKSDDLTGELYRLELVRRLMVLTTGTGTIRLTVANDHEQLYQLQKDSAEQVKKYQQNWVDTQAKLEKLKSTDMQIYEDRLASAERTSQERIFRTEQTIYQQVRKYNLRTAPLGRDNANNMYWGFQQKSKDIPSWGTWIVCEMKRLPQQSDGKQIGNYIAALVAARQRAIKEKAEQAAEKAAEKKANNDKTTTNGTSSADAAAADGESHGDDENAMDVDKPETAEKPEADTKTDTKAEPSTPKKPKKRRPKLPHFEEKPGLYYVEGRFNLLSLASWIKGQAGPKPTALIEEIETLAHYCYD